MDRLNLYAEEQAEIAVLKGHRRVEWLATRYLIHTLLPESDRVPCLKDEFGKPHLVGMAEQISFSHSHDLVAAIHGTVPVGIDIQYKVPRITHLGHKFVSEREAALVQNMFDVEYLHVVWGAKECMYKAYGRRQLDFKQHLYLDWDGLVKKEGNTQGWLHRDSVTQHYTINYQWFADWVLVFATAA